MLQGAKIGIKQSTKPPLCECGCGGYVKKRKTANRSSRFDSYVWNRFIEYHGARQNHDGNNIDIAAYEFQDLDLKIAVASFSGGERRIILLHLMGHSQERIGKMLGVSRSLISKKLMLFIKVLKVQLCEVR